MDGVLEKESEGVVERDAETEAEGEGRVEWMRHRSGMKLDTSEVNETKPFLFCPLRFFTLSNARLDNNTLGSSPAASNTTTSTTSAA